MISPLLPVLHVSSFFCKNDAFHINMPNDPIHLADSDAFLAK